MVDAHRVGEFGRLLAVRTTAHSLRLHEELCQGRVYPHPVLREPPFRSFDPSLTFEVVTECDAVAMVPGAWSSRKVILPLESDLKAALLFLAGLSGCRSPVCWEFVGTPEEQSFFLSASREDVGFIAAQWSAAFPNGAITEEEAVVPWPRSFDGLSLFDVYPLSSYQCACQLLSPWPHLLRLNPTFLQLFVEPVRGAWRQNAAWMLQAQKALGHRSPTGRTLVERSLDEPLFAASLRFGTTSPSVARDLASVAGLFSSEGKPFAYRTANDYAVLGAAGIDRMVRERLSHTTGFFVTSSELAPLLTPPDESLPAASKLSFVRGLPVPPSLAGPGLFRGTNYYRGVPVDVFQPSDQPNRCCLGIGSSRMGKTLAMMHHVVALAKRDVGLAVLDPHRSMVFELPRLLGEEAEDRVIFLDFDDAVPVAYNAFDNPNEDEYGRLTTEYLHSFKSLFDANFSRMQHFLGMGIYALFVLRANLSTLLSLFAKTPEGESLRRQVILKAKNEAVRRFFQDEFQTHRSEAFAPMLSRLTSFFLDDRTLRTFSQVENKVDIAGAMDQGKIVLIAPPASPDPAGPIGGFLVAQALHAAFRRVGTSRARQHFHFFIDEFPRFLSSAKMLQSIIDEAAKGGLSVSLAHQETGQVPGDLLKTLLTIPNIFVFGVNLQDAKFFAPLFNGRVTAETLAGQRTGSVYARMGQDIVNFQSPPPPATFDAAAADRIIRYSREHYYASPTATTVVPGRRPRVIDTLEDA